MAYDPTDFDRLMKGEKDLSFCNFNGADLSNMEIKDRKFDRSNITSVNLFRSDLRGSSFVNNHFHNATLSAANFDGCRFKNCVFEHTVLNGAILSNINMVGGVITYVNFNGVDIRGARFDKVSITDEANFDDALFDEYTNFDGSKGTRSLSRKEIFLDYEFIDGVFKRRKDEKTDFYHRVSGVVSYIDEAKALFDSLSSSSFVGVPSAGIGHNGPPDSVPLEPGEQFELRASMERLRAVVAVGEVDSVGAKSASEKIRHFAEKIASWVMPRIGLAADEFAKQLGKTAGDFKTWAGGWLMLSGQLDRIVAAVASLAN